MPEDKNNWRLTKAKIELRKSRTRLAEANNRRERSRAEQDVQIWSQRVSDLEVKE